MLKKAIPLVLMSGLVLTACTNNGTVPNNNETPMEKVEERTRDWTPDVNGGQTGPNMDGIDNNRNNGTPNGVINEGNTTIPRDETIVEPNPNTPNEVIIEEDGNRNGVNNR